MKVSYLKHKNLESNHFILYRRTEITEKDERVYEKWNNRRGAKWEIAQDACGAFFGMEHDTTDITEEEVREILAQHGQALEPYNV